MTSLAYRNGVLASDSRCCRGNRIDAGSATKVLKTTDGRLLGLTGEYAAGWRYMQWLASSGPGGNGTGPRLGEANVVVEVLTDGTVVLHESDGTYPAPADAEFHAWGSGMEACLAAMYANASASRAVEIACLCDTSSGGPVQTVRLTSRQTPAVNPRRKAPQLALAA